jgi:hypothetical protein
MPEISTFWYLRAGGRRSYCPRMNIQTRGRNLRRLVVSESVTLRCGRHPHEDTISVFTRSLVEARPFRWGRVLLTYRPTGPGARAEV